MNIKSNLKKINDGLFLTILLVAIINFFGRLWFMNIPASYDEMNYLDGVTYVFNNGLNPFVDFWGYKPPVMFWPVALVYKFIFVSKIWARLYIYFFSSLSLVFCYLLAKQLFTRLIGFWSTILLFCFPLFFTQSLLFQDAVPFTALFLASIYFFLAKRWGWYGIVSSLFILTKEPALFIVSAIFIYQLFKSRRNFKVLFLTSLPLVSFVVWMLLNKYFLGWYLWPFNASLLIKHNLSDYWDKALALEIGKDVFTSHFVWLVFLVWILGLLIPTEDKVKKRRKILLIFILIFCFYLLFYYLNAFIFRYVLFLYPLLFMGCLYLVERLFKKKIAVVIFGFIVCVLFIVSNFYNLITNPILDGDKDLRHFKTIMLHRETAELIEKNYKDDLVIAAWPVFGYFMNPEFGYIKEDINILPLRCGECTIPGDINSLARDKYVLINSSMTCCKQIKNLSGWENKDKVVVTVDESIDKSEIMIFKKE